jgi:hypothetical protein
MLPQTKEHKYTIPAKSFRTPLHKKKNFIVHGLCIARIKKCTVEATTAILFYSISVL